MSKLGSSDNPLKVAIVGAGPSGFYAADALINSELKVEINLLEKLCAPYGLVRSGVAPDHPLIKKSIEKFALMAEPDEFNYIGNVSVGMTYESWKVEAFIDNVFDKSAILNIDTQQYTPKVVTNRPRTIGLRFSYDYY